MLFQLTLLGRVPRPNKATGPPSPPSDRSHDLFSIAFPPEQMSIPFVFPSRGRGFDTFSTPERLRGDPPGTGLQVKKIIRWASLPLLRYSRYSTPYGSIAVCLLHSNYCKTTGSSGSGSAGSSKLPLFSRSKRCLLVFCCSVSASEANEPGYSLATPIFFFFFPFLLDLGIYGGEGG